MRLNRRFLQPAVPVRGMVFALMLLVLILITGVYVWAQNEVVLNIEGSRTFFKTRAGTVGEFLEENGVPIKSDDVVKPAIHLKLDDDSEVRVYYSKTVFLKTDNTVIAKRTTAATAGEFLAQQNIGVSPKDIVNLKSSDKLKDGTLISILRKSTKGYFVSCEIPFKVVERKDPKLKSGTRKVIAPGRAGEKSVFVREYYSGRKMTSQRIISEKIVKDPVDQIVAVGGKSGARGYSYAFNFGVSRGGKELSCEATAYTPGHGCGYRTATGIAAGRGIVAVDPKVIPLGSKLYIPGYGYALAADTGGAIKGMRIDLCFDTLAEAKKFGRRKVVVKIIP